MKCFYCKSNKTQVINSRKINNTSSVWRRRKCLSCEEVFTTEESISISSFFVIKKNRARKRFVYEKLFLSIFIAISQTKKVDIGDSSLVAKVITHEVLHDLSTLHSTLFSSKEIICMVYKKLLKMNKSAAFIYGVYSPYRIKVLHSNGFLKDIQ
jgi:transcriptional repressor NrdR